MRWLVRFYNWSPKIGFELAVQTQPVQKLGENVREMLDRVFWKNPTLNYSQPIYCEAVADCGKGKCRHFVRLPGNASGCPDLFFEVGNALSAQRVIAELYGSPFKMLSAEKLVRISYVRHVLLWLSRGMPAGDFGDEQIRSAVAFFSNGEGKSSRDFLSEAQWSILSQKAEVEYFPNLLPVSAFWDGYV